MTEIEKAIQEATRQESGNTAAVKKISSSALKTTSKSGK